MLFLTKSKFVDGTECPFKLTSDYQGEAEENSFLDRVDESSTVIKATVKYSF